ncbi:MAG: glucuronyl hydrolase [Chitinophagaceae bacterium]|nr:glucuronyl hydrolase [Chitinophagaceae bacterium]
MKKIGLILLLIIAAGVSFSQSASYAVQMANTVMNTWKDSFAIQPGKPVKWTYDQSVVLKGIEGLWKNTGEGKYFNYIQKSMDFFVDDKGDIKTYKAGDFTLDNIAPGRNLLLLYNVTGKDKYLKAVNTLHKQLQSQPRTNEGGFWHKQIYPSQMWLDGLYMAEPFYTEYANTFHEDSAYNDIARQFILMEKNAREPKTGLLYHGYDESRKEKWADKTTGLSPNFWGRAMGWYGMGLVDVLENFPENNPNKKTLAGIFKRFAAAVAKVQDAKSGLWWDILNSPGREKNYLEASASSMFIYALAKGVRLGYLPLNYSTVAKKGYDGIIKNFIKTENGQTNLYGTVSVSGLGGNPYRDGSYDYYVGEKVVVNDPKGVGAFLQAANEMDIAQTLAYGKGKTVLLDNYFNHETKKDVTGTTINWHYVWEEMDNGGLSLFGHVFNKYGVQTKTLYGAPSLQNLKAADIYIIMDPDNAKESSSPNYIEPQHIDAIYNWVKDGGTLLLFGNDSGNVELPHFNQLAQRFGFQFNFDNLNRVVGTQFEMGAFYIPAGHPIFKTAKKIHIKEYASQTVTGPAQSIFTDKNIVVMSVAKVGKGTVFAVGDPWFYNEYLDGRRLTPDFDNYKAAEDLVRWAIDQSNKKGK